MIGPLFTINRSNIGRAAIAAASRPIPEDTPAMITLARCKEDSGSETVCIEVSTPKGFSRSIRISEAKIASILQIQDYDACREACQAFIDDRAEHVRTAVLDAQAHCDRLDDSDLDVGSGHGC